MFTVEVGTYLPSQHHRTGREPDGQDSIPFYHSHPLHSTPPHLYVLFDGDEDETSHVLSLHGFIDFIISYLFIESTLMLAELVRSSYLSTYGLTST